MASMTTGRLTSCVRAQRLAEVGDRLDPVATAPNARAAAAKSASEKS
jgi:hypothetical protein